MTIDKSIQARWYGAGRPIDQIRAIVFHYTANTGHTATARGNALYFAQTERKASAHFIVDEGEIVYQCVPLENSAWAVGDGSGGRMGDRINNWNSVNIEMVSHTDALGAAYIPMKTQKNAAKLYRMLQKQLPYLRYTARHYDVSAKQCPQPMVDERRWMEFLQLLQEDTDMTKQEFLSLAATGDFPSTWAEEATSWAKKQGLFAGDGEGNFGWQQPITREALAQVLYNWFCGRNA